MKTASSVVQHKSKGYEVPEARRGCRYYFLDPLAYTIWGLIGSQLSDVSDVEVPSQTGMTLPLNEYMTTTYKFRHPFIGAAAGILIAFIVLFHFATAFALQKLNYLKR